VANACTEAAVVVAMWRAYWSAITLKFTAKPYGCCRVA
jgi:hypothetical protein